LTVITGPLTPVTVRADGPVRHGRTGLRPRPKAFAGTAHRFGKDVHFDRFLRSIGLRHGSAADEFAILDVGERRLLDPYDHHFVGEVELQRVTLRGFRRHGVAVDFTDDAGEALGFRRLRQGRRNGERSAKG